MSRALALLLTVATGTSGLVYEVTWERMLAVLLGSHAEATAAVLAFFLGGLAVGYSLFGKLSLRLVATDSEGGPRRLLLGYGAVEATIGLYALAFLPLFRIAQAISLRGPVQPGLAFAWDAMLAAALVLPGSALMGATIPMLTQALSRGVGDATKTHAAIYGANTLGAFAGALAASYALIPAWGMVGTLRAMAVINLSAGIGFALLGWLQRPLESAAPQAPARAPLRLGPYASAAFLLGAAMMTLQTALIRVGSLALGASLFTFATVVAVFVLCIALGSLAVGALTRVPALLLPACAWLLFALVLALYGVVEDAPYYAHMLRALFRDQVQGFLPYHVAVLAGLLVVVGPAIALSGATLPLLFDRLRREYGELGDAAGRLYGWNTAGSLVGALFGGYALFYWLDLHHVYRLAVAALAVAAALLTPPLRVGARPLRPIWAAIPALALLALLPPWSQERLSVGAFRMRQKTPATFAGPAAFTAEQWTRSRIVSADDDPTANIVVREMRGDDGSWSRSLFTNGKSDSSVTGDRITTTLLALVPAWLARHAERIFVIGYGTGVTASELAQLEEAREVIVAEISPAVAAAAPLFDASNGGASQNPKIRIVRGDAYRVLLRSPGRFDVITSEPSNPWVNGVEMLYSVEFLRAAKSRLAPGGVFCQWFHTYEADRETIDLVLRSFASVFDHVALWYGLGVDLLLIGFDDPSGALDLPRLLARAERPDFKAGFTRGSVPDVVRLFAHELWPVGVLGALDLEGPLHTLLHPRLSHAAARAFFVGTTGKLPSSAAREPAAIGARNSLIRLYAASRGGLSEDERRGFTGETCRYRARECVTLLAQWHHDRPDSPRLADLEQRIRSMPAMMREIDLRQVTALQRFYGGAVEAPEGIDPVRLAQQETDRFVRFYTHAAPFSRDALSELFAACAQAPGREEACARARRQLEASLGPLGGEG